MTLRTLPASLSLEGKRILMRVDWNIPLTGLFRAEDLLKVTRSLETVEALRARGAILILLTHLGRPTKKDPNLSTARLVPVLLKRYRLHVKYHSAMVSKAAERDALKVALEESKPGEVHLLENVRFEAGEDSCDKDLVKAYASLGDLFVNDAFASSHRKHASVFGLAKAMTSYAGPGLAQEVKTLSVLLTKPKEPFYAMVAGGKLSTKIPVLKLLLKQCDRVFIGGAMATVFQVARGISMGNSPYEKEALPEAKALYAKYAKQLVFPSDVMCVEAIAKPSTLMRVSIDEVPKGRMAVDIGTKSLKDWAVQLQDAKTIMWNGPLGVIEVHEYGFGTRFMAKALAQCVKKQKAFAVVGGGDTLPSILETKTDDKLSHVSCGGGAMLEFLTLKGKLPGIVPLLK